MRVICDAPGQTCNRLWTYLTSIAQCVAERKKMMIIFYDWTIEDFPHLLHAPFIYYPLWQPWFLHLPKEWGWYKHLTWKVTMPHGMTAVFLSLGRIPCFYVPRTGTVQKQKSFFFHQFQRGLFS